MPSAYAESRVTIRILLGRHLLQYPRFFSTSIADVEEQSIGPMESLPALTEGRGMASEKDKRAARACLSCRGRKTKCDL